MIKIEILEQTLHNNLSDNSKIRNNKTSILLSDYKDWIIEKIKMKYLKKTLYNVFKDLNIPIGSYHTFTRYISSLIKDNSFDSETSKLNSPTITTIKDTNYE